MGLDMNMVELAQRAQRLFFSSKKRKKKRRKKEKRQENASQSQKHLQWLNKICKSFSDNIQNHILKDINCRECVSNILENLKLSKDHGFRRLTKSQLSSYGYKAFYTICSCPMRTLQISVKDCLINKPKFSTICLGKRELEEREDGERRIEEESYLDGGSKFRIIQLIIQIGSEMWRTG